MLEIVVLDQKVPLLGQKKLQNLWVPSSPPLRKFTLPKIRLLILGVTCPTTLLWKISAFAFHPPFAFHQKHTRFQSTYSPDSTQLISFCLTQDDAVPAAGKR